MLQRLKELSIFLSLLLELKLELTGMRTRKRLELGEQLCIQLYRILLRRILLDRGYHNYCIGLDWLGNTGRYLYVEPKINKGLTRIFNTITDSEYEKLRVDEDSHNIESDLLELDYLKMLLQVTNVPESNTELKGLIQIDWEAKPIQIEQKDDKLTPFLVVQYLQLVKAIVRKGLKKNYYKVQENLNNRIKGKILVGQHIKQNVFKNRFTDTFCEYQQFGEDHAENRFLKKVLQFTSSYIENQKNLFGDKYTDLQHTINYCRPVFELISNQLSDYELKHIKSNPFYKDYVTAIDFGKKILKRFAIRISGESGQRWNRQQLNRGTLPNPIP